MITLDDLRRFATALPEVEEFIHFRLPGFKVKGRPFAGMERGDTTAVFSGSQNEAATAVAADPAVYSEVWRTAAMKIWVGLRVDLSAISPEQIQQLVEHAWRNKAPMSVVAAYDAAAPSNTAVRLANARREARARDVAEAVHRARQQPC
ncbi:MmcQ/YjbR family DNA-binding protein [Nonomuraea sp. NPDC049637]|uniref:MmcQ/YjbR family DNA-binding protein n=1 Tax=Nonomuraea sp. NPDC049637 TaxID=3154356 RepID=UPI00342F7CB1